MDVQFGTFIFVEMNVNAYLWIFNGALSKTTALYPVQLRKVPQKGTQKGTQELEMNGM